MPCSVMTASPGTVAWDLREQRCRGPHRRYRRVVIAGDAIKRRAEPLNQLSARHVGVDGESHVRELPAALAALFNTVLLRRATTAPGSIPAFIAARRFSTVGKSA